MGSGPFKFKDRQPGALISGAKYENYHHKGQPYLDGFEAIFAKKQSLRVQAIRGGRAHAEFRGLPPKSRDDLVKALGDKITVQESDWNCSQIGRASCRERVVSVRVDHGGRRIIKKKRKT